MEFIFVSKTDKEQIRQLSRLASDIVREFFTPLIGAAQNEYMIKKFQTEEAITEQLRDGYQYYFASYEGKHCGFLAFFPKDGKLYLSKFYLAREYRGRGLAKELLAFVKEQGRKAGISVVFLNVNRRNPAVEAYKNMGFQIVRREKKEIGGGFVMDDYVMEAEI